MRERFVKQGAGATTEKLDAARWPDGRGAVPLELKTGTPVVFHGLLPHYRTTALPHYRTTALPHYRAPDRYAVSRHAFSLRDRPKQRLRAAQLAAARRLTGSARPAFQR